MTEMSAVQLVSLGLATIACGWDLRTRRIPQVLTLGGAVAGLAFHLFTGGWQGGFFSFAGWFVGIAIFFAPFALGGLGAGDVKLLGALGAWLGAPMCSGWRSIPGSRAVSWPWSWRSRGGISVRLSPTCMC